MAEVVSKQGRFVPFFAQQQVVDVLAKAAATDCLRDELEDFHGQVGQLRHVASECCSGEVLDDAGSQE